MILWLIIAWLVVLGVVYLLLYGYGEQSHIETH